MITNLIPQNNKKHPKISLKLQNMHLFALNLQKFTRRTSTYRLGSSGGQDLVIMGFSTELDGSSFNEEKTTKEM